MGKLKFKKMWPWKLMITQKVIFSIFLLIKGVLKPDLKHIFNNTI